MAVHALFNREARRVLIGLFEPGDQRLEFIPINIADNEAVAAAERGFCAIYHILRRAENLCISYEVKGGGEKIIGSSVGLAFALALFEELKDMDLPLAATGDISDGTKNARVLPVKFIPEKLTAAIRALSETKGGVIFYPYENDIQVSDKLRREADEKGIILRPVRTLAEAVESIKQEKVEKAPQNRRANEKEKARRGNPILIILLLAFFAYLGGAFSLQFAEFCSMPESIRRVVPAMYPWIERPSLDLKVNSVDKEEQILPLMCQRLMPALEAQKWHLDAVISCRSRLLNQTYTYWISFDKAILETGQGQANELSLETCEGSGSTLQDAIEGAIERVWENLQNLNPPSLEQDNTIMGESQ